MKKKLLITLGDSFTEGWGCYDYTKTIVDYNDPYQNNRFHELGWPNRLGQKLNYDKVINLGWGGSSNSAHVKLFVEKILPKDFSNYDVLVIWMIAPPERFSFYSGGQISQFHPNIELSGSVNQTLGESYIMDIENLEEDSILETIFYIRCLEQMCENNSFELLITTWDVSIFKKINNLYPSKYFMKSSNNKPIVESPFSDKSDNKYKSKICDHPNELGYERISVNMMDSISLYNPHLINEAEVEKFEWIWDGMPILWDWEDDSKKSLNLI